MGEVLSGPWYEHRNGVAVAGPGNGFPPSLSETWKVLSVKGFGVRPGLLIEDSNNRSYWLQFDPVGSLELDTGAAMIASRFFYSLGYHTPESYIVYFRRDNLTPSDTGKQITSLAKQRKLTDEDIDNFLSTVASDTEKGYRALATRIPVGSGKLLGPFSMDGVRSDDPNDVVPHEHRRDLRGLYVFASWLNLAKIRPTSTLDILLDDDGVPSIEHYFIDFSAALGSGGDRPKKAEAGREPYFDGATAVKNTLGVGIYTPDWMRASYPKLASVGHFDYETFQPDRWTPLHKVAPFENRLPDDEFWAARKLMAFSDTDIEELVLTGQYSDPDAVAWLVRCLIERRDRIGRTYFPKVLPLVGFRVEGGRLSFRDLEVEHGFVPRREYRVRWSEFDNSTELQTPIDTWSTRFDLPESSQRMRSGSYLSATIEGNQEAKDVTAYLQKEGKAFRVVGVERTWPGKVLARPQREVETSFPGYFDLDLEQSRLLEGLSQKNPSENGRKITPSEYFGTLTISQRSTFDAITHALINSPLTDSKGNALGKAIDLIKSLERIAGQVKGERRDQQFRLYGTLTSDAIERLDRSEEFYRDHENTAHHDGYPVCFRLGGNLPSLQFSISRDGRKVDIDIDYRSGGWPVALLNGHFTSANSDVRSGDNIKRHNRRWDGLIAWWRGKQSTATSEARLAGISSAQSGEPEKTETRTSKQPTRQRQ
jgi:hypothetical protein